MAGYIEFSKSVNAALAEDRGLLTATALARRIGGGATAAGVAAVLVPSEWHHTSSYFNATNYYDFESDAAELAEDQGVALEEGERLLAERIRDASRRIRAEARAAKVAAKEVAGVFIVRNISGRGRYRFVSYRVHSGTVSVRGDGWVRFPDGGRKASHHVRRVSPDADMDSQAALRRAWEAGEIVY